MWNYLCSKTLSSSKHWPQILDWVAPLSEAQADTCLGNERTVKYKLLPTKVWIRTKKILYTDVLIIHISNFNNKNQSIFHLHTVVFWKLLLHSIQGYTPNPILPSLFYTHSNTYTFKLKQKMCFFLFFFAFLLP